MRPWPTACCKSWPPSVPSWRRPSASRAATSRAKPSAPRNRWTSAGNALRGAACRTRPELIRLVALRAGGAAVLLEAHRHRHLGHADGAERVADVVDLGLQIGGQ